jgi:hypothetical protein
MDLVDPEHESLSIIGIGLSLVNNLLPAVSAPTRNTNTAHTHMSTHTHIHTHEYTHTHTHT